MKRMTSQHFFYTVEAEKLIDFIPFYVEYRKEEEDCYCTT